MTKGKLPAAGFCRRLEEPVIDYEPMFRDSANGRGGFTLIELLLAIASIAILATE
jgi:prepilin-type N-terminal cleavage/methylation domain-containing protein